MTYKGRFSNHVVRSFFVVIALSLFSISRSRWDLHGKLCLCQRKIKTTYNLECHDRHLYKKTKGVSFQKERDGFVRTSLEAS